MVSNRSFDRLNLTHKRTSCVSLLLFLFLRNCTLTLKHRLNVLPIIADCILYFESDENRGSHREELNLLLDSISTLCSFQCSRAQLSFSRKFHMMRNFFILPDSFSFVKHFFQVFSTNFFVSGAVVSDSFYILPNPSIFVNYFFHLF